MSGQIPFVIGQWVCGPRFFGRGAWIAEILGSGPRWQWIAGLRRIGKTSLLKQLDFLAGADGRSLPVFWDLQGVESVEDLGFTFTDALLDAEVSLARRGILVEEVEDRDLFAALEKLGRALGGTELLLLCDEVDELIALGRSVPGLAARLWQAVAGIGPVRVVIASSLRLCDQGSIEPFPAPLFLGAMTDDEARALLRQSPSFTDAAVEAIREQCGNHPMLLQIVAKRFLELGDLDETFRQVAADRTVQHLFAVDCELLAPAEREALRSLAACPRRLLDLGLVREEGHGLTVPNRFLASWLRGH